MNVVLVDSFAVSSIYFSVILYIWAIPHWRAYMAKQIILFQQDETFTGDVKNM